MRTGYYANTTGHQSQVHVVSIRGGCERPLCRYRPTASMTFQWCASGACLPYLDCARCRAILDRRAHP